VPVVLYLVLSGHILAAGGMAIWGILAVGLIDNFLGPKIISGRVKVHPLLVFLSVLGGLQLFGIIGFLLGPIVMAVVLAMIDIYRSQAAKW
jgi:predicted PurR-regulated permease PerM